MSWSYGGDKDMDHPDEIASANPDPVGSVPEGIAPRESERGFEKSLKDLEETSRDLKRRIEDERRRENLPIDPALGDPEIERRSADGSNDLPDRDED